MEDLASWTLFQAEQRTCRITLLPRLILKSLNSKLKLKLILQPITQLQHNLQVVSAFLVVTLNKFKRQLPKTT